MALEAPWALRRSDLPEAHLRSLAVDCRARSLSPAEVPVERELRSVALVDPVAAAFMALAVQVHPVRATLAALR